MNIGNLKNALDDTNLALKLKKDFGDGYLQLSTIFLKLNNISEAHQCLLKARQYNANPIGISNIEASLNQILHNMNYGSSGYSGNSPYR